MNRPDTYRRDAAVYVDLAGLGGPEEHPGAEMLTSWSTRRCRRLPVTTLGVFRSPACG